MTAQLIDFDTFMEGLSKLQKDDRPALVDWLDANVTTRDTEWQMLESLPRIAAVFLKHLPGVGTVESWTIDTRNTPVVQADLQEVQLVTAALNSDDDIITGIVKAILDSPEEHRAEVMVGLLTIVRDVMNIVLEQAKKP